jgi:hypothetical protein
MRKIDLNEKVSRKFISTCEVVFEPHYDTEQEAQYFGQVVRPELERQAIESWERSLECAS